MKVTTIKNGIFNDEDYVVNQFTSKITGISYGGELPNIPISFLAESAEAAERKAKQLILEISMGTDVYAALDTLAP